MNSPLAQGFVEAIRPEERQPFDTKPFRVNSADSKLETLRFHARRYGIDQRTAYRYQAAGVDLDDPCKVALHISGLKRPDPHALDCVAKILRTELNTK